MKLDKFKNGVNKVFILPYIDADNYQSQYSRLLEEGYTIHCYWYVYQ